MRNVSCDGDEKSLSECKYRQDNSTNSCPAQGVGVRCAVSGKMMTIEFISWQSHWDRK